MIAELPFQYLEMEIPELEDREIVGKSFFLKIHGIEHERPLVRINNKYYQGKWILKNNFVVFSKKKINLLGLTVHTDNSLFERKPKIKIKTIELKKNLKSTKIHSKNTMCSKKLKLYRLPMIIRREN